MTATSANVDMSDRSVTGVGVCFVPFKVGLQGNLECLRRRDGPTKMMGTIEGFPNPPAMDSGGQSPPTPDAKKNLNREPHPRTPS